MQNPAQATRHWELAATQWTEFEGNHQSPTPPGESCARLPAGLRPHRHLCHRKSTWSAQKGTVGIKGRQSVAAPLACDFCKSDHLQLSISHVWPFNVAKCCQRNSRDNGLNIRNNKTRLTNWPNIATKFARRGTVRTLLFSNWSSWHRAASATQVTEFESNHQSPTPPGESSARLPAGLRPHRHLWCHRQSAWSAQTGTVGIKGRQSVAALACDFCKSDHLQLSISHVWPFNVAKCCQRNSRDNGLNIRNNKTRLTNWPNIATKFARRGTMRSLLLSNWSSWHRAASATQVTEFESNTQSSTSPGESCARLPAGLRPHWHHWCHRQSTWSAQTGTVGIKGRQSVAALACDFCKSDHLQLSIAHVWPFNVAKCCQRNSRDNGLNIRKNKTRLTNWPNIATKFARRGTMRSLLLSNWSSWHRAASATQWTESESNAQSSTSPGESSARLPAGLRPHRHLW